MSQYYVAFLEVLILLFYIPYQNFQTNKAICDHILKQPYFFAGSVDKLAKIMHNITKIMHNINR